MRSKNPKKFEKVMEEYAKGSLKSSSGKKVGLRQALAIAYSESKNKRKGKK